MNTVNSLPVCREIRSAYKKQLDRIYQLKTDQEEQYPTPADEFLSSCQLLLDKNQIPSHYPPSKLFNKYHKRLVNLMYSLGVPLYEHETNPDQEWPTGQYYDVDTEEYW